MSTIRVQGIPQATTIEDISQAFSVERDCVSLASTKTTNPPASQTATATLETDAIAKRYLGKPPKIHGKEVFIDNDFFGLTVLSSGANATAEYWTPSSGSKFILYAEIDIGEYSAVGQVPVGRSRLRLRRGIKYLFRNPGRERLPERWPIAEGRWPNWTKNSFLLLSRHVTMILSLFSSRFLYFTLPIVSSYFVFYLQVVLF